MKHKLTALLAVAVLAFTTSLLTAGGDACKECCKGKCSECAKCKNGKCKECCK